MDPGLVWTAVGAIAQGIAAVATLLTLVYLSYQLKQTDKQITLMREDAQRAERARHDAVWPLVRVISCAISSGQDQAGQPILQRNSNDYSLTLTLWNGGIGPARNVTLSKCTNTGEAEVLMRVELLQPGQPCPLYTKLTLEVQQVTLLVSWTDLFGELFKQEYYVDRTDRFVELWRRAEDSDARMVEFRGEFSQSD